MSAEEEADRKLLERSGRPSSGKRALVELARTSAGRRGRRSSPQRRGAGAAPRIARPASRPRPVLRGSGALAVGEGTDPAEQYAKELLLRARRRLEPSRLPRARSTNARSGQPPNAETSIAARIIAVANAERPLRRQPRRPSASCVPRPANHAVKLDRRTYDLELRPADRVGDERSARAQRATARSCDGPSRAMRAQHERSGGPRPRRRSDKPAARSNAAAAAAWAPRASAGSPADSSSAATASSTAVGGVRTMPRTTPGVVLQGSRECTRASHDAHRASPTGRPPTGSTGDES